MDRVFGIVFAHRNEVVLTLAMEEGRKMFIGPLIVLGVSAVVLVILLRALVASKSIRLKDGGRGALKLGSVKAEVGVSYLASTAPVVNYLITNHGEMVAEGKCNAPGAADTFVVFPRDPAHDDFPFILAAKIISRRIMKITLHKRSGFKAG